jgi:hypothetical protein
MVAVPFVCSIKGPFPVPSETFVHLFFECNHVNSVINSITNRFLQNFELTRQNYFITEVGEFECIYKPLNIFFDVLRYFIWQAKLEKTVPVTQKIFSEMNYLFSVIIGSSKKNKYAV